MKQKISVIVLLSFLLTFYTYAGAGTITKGLISEQDIKHYDGANETFTRSSSTGATLTLTPVGGEVDVLMAYGGGVNRTNTTITSALTAIGTTNKRTIVLRPGTWTISANVDWSAYGNVTIKILPGALISHGAYTIKIAKIEAGDYQIFSGTGAITLSTGAATEYHARWCGATGDGTTNDTTNFQKFLSLVPVGGKIVIPELTFVVQGLYADQNSLVWDCKGWLKPYANTATPVLYTGRTAAGLTQLTRGWRGNINIGGYSLRSADWDDVTGIQMDYLTESELTINCAGMGIGLALNPTFNTGGTASNAYVAYNKFYLMDMANNKVAISIDPQDADSSANENTFYGGRFSKSSGTYVADTIYIKITRGNGHVPNNNRFYAPSFEGPGQVLNCLGAYNHIFDARMELTRTGVAGTDYAEPYIYFGAAADGNTVDMSHNSTWITYYYKDLGAATRTDDKKFTIATDLRSWLWPGAPIIVTVGGTDYYTYVIGSSYAAPNTTVYVSSPVITDNPTATVVSSIQMYNSGTDQGLNNKININYTTVTSIAPRMEIADRQFKAWTKSSITMSTPSSNYPAISLNPSSSNNDIAFSVNSFTDRMFAVDHNGQLNMLRFNTQTLANDATPSVKGYTLWLTGGTTTITDFDDGVTGQIITIIAEHSVTITDGTNIFLSGSTNFGMAATDTLTLICKANNKWYETGRSDNT